MTISSFSFPTSIKFGAGARKLVAANLLEAGCKRPLIVTDKALGALPVLAEFQSHLAGLDVAVFSGVFGNPTCSQVMAGAAAYNAHQADCVIGFGGGAALARQSGQSSRPPATSSAPSSDCTTNLARSPAEQTTLVCCGKKMGEAMAAPTAAR